MLLQEPQLQNCVYCCDLVASASLVVPRTTHSMNLHFSLGHRRNRVKVIILNNNHQEVIPRRYGTRASMTLCIYPQKYLPVFFSWNQVIFENQIWMVKCYWWCFCDICIAVCLSGFQWLCSSAWGWASYYIPDLCPLGFSWLRGAQKCILGLFLKLLLIISLPSGSCNWTDTSKLSGFSVKYLRRKILTIILELFLNHILLPITITPWSSGWVYGKRILSWLNNGFITC